MKNVNNPKWKLAKIGKYVVSISLASTLFTSYINLHYQSNASTHKINYHKNKLNNYVVKQNDTIAKIANKFNVKPSYVIKHFKLKHYNVLFVGQNLSKQNQTYKNLHTKYVFNKYQDYNVKNHKIIIVKSINKTFDIPKPASTNSVSTKNISSNSVQSNSISTNSSVPSNSAPNSSLSSNSTVTTVTTSVATSNEVDRNSSAKASETQSSSVQSQSDLSASSNNSSNQPSSQTTSPYELDNRMEDDSDIETSLADSKASAASQSASISAFVQSSLAQSASIATAQFTAFSLSASQNLAASQSASMVAASKAASLSYVNAVNASQSAYQASVTTTLNSLNANQLAYQSFSATQSSIAASNNALSFNNHDNQVTSATMNKARYNPGEQANISINLHNKANNQTTSQVQFNFYKDNQRVYSTASSVTLTKNDNKAMSVNWNTPNQDYQGYRVEIVVNGQVQKVLAIDVSSDVNKFPRYGAITTFKPNTDNSQLLQDMKNWNINNLEYYDAYQAPQTPINYDNPTGNWEQDWAVWLSQQDKIKSGQVIKNTVDQAHQLGMDSMFYNMIYAITGNANDKAYLKSIGVKPEWLLYHADGAQKDQLFQFPMANYIKDHNDTNYIKATQTYLDITNPEVVDWIVARMYPVLKDLNFDGWHGDTIGNNDLMYAKNADGSIKNEYHVSDKLGEFANMVKERLHDKKFIINTVSNIGQDNVAKSKSDIDYSEMWDGNYINVVDAIKRVYEESGKSLVVPGYLQSKYASTHQGANFNENAVLLFDAMVDSAGGSRMEVVDGQHLLVGEYFPDKSLNVSDSLKQQMQNYQTFITAYENLLRDGQKDNYNGINVYDNSGNDIRSDNASPNSVYAYSRSSDNSETIQLINMLGVSSSNWQDNDNTKEKPITLNNFHVSYYPSQKYQPGQSNEVHHIYLASPDGDNNNQSIEVPFTWKHNQYGYYLDITVPSLQRWDMLYLK